MGKTMAKANVIWGEQHSVSLASFSSAHMAQIIDLIHKNIGPKEVIDHGAAQSAVLKAKGNKKMKDGYVKVGLIGTDLVLRCKEKKFLGDIEVDAILVKSYPRKKLTWEGQQMLDQLEQTTRQVGERQEAERQEKERQEKERQEKERQARLHQVMNTPDQEGVTMRDKILGAAKKAQKLGVGDYAKNKLKEQGLQPMHEDYHAEAIDPKNRYGRYLPQLRKLWEQHASQVSSFGKWLDDVEANKTSVPGVNEARAVWHPEVGKVVQPGGVAGGRVVYLDDETRKPYVATVNKGAITGQNVKNGSVIFVIGPDNKIYAGSKARGTAGTVGAFNHSSFFSGGPVKSAGTLTVSGGRITSINDQSGHYAPTTAMVIQAVRKFGGGDQDWLSKVQVAVGGKSMTGAQLLGEDHEKQSVEIWGKYSVGTVSREDATKVLQAASDGNWLVRVGSNGKLVITYRQGDTVSQDLITNIGAKGLDRKKLLQANQVRDLLKTVSTTTQRGTGGNGPSTQGTKAPRRKLKEAPESESQEDSGVTAEMEKSMRASEGWHGNLNRAGAELLLKDKPNAWLLREGRDGAVALSFYQKQKLGHTLINTAEEYQKMVRFTTRYRDQVVKP